MGQGVGYTDTGIKTTTTAAIQRGYSCAQVGDQRHRHPSSARKNSSGSRPASYQNMVKFKMRLQYNSMGERVVIQTAVDGIDAFAARSRQCSHRGQQQKEQDRSETHTGVGPPETGYDEGRGESGVVTSTAVGAQKHIPSVFGNPGDGGNNGGNHGSDDGGGSAFGAILNETPQLPPPLNISKSLGFGFPDFSSVCSKVCSWFTRTLSAPLLMTEGLLFLA